MSDQQEDELWRNVSECAKFMDEMDKRLDKQAEARLKQKEPVTISFKRPYRSTHSEA